MIIFLAKNTILNQLSTKNAKKAHQNRISNIAKINL